MQMRRWVAMNGSGTGGRPSLNQFGPIKLGSGHRRRLAGVWRNLGAVHVLLRMAHSWRSWCRTWGSRRSGRSGVTWMTLRRRSRRSGVDLGRSRLATRVSWMNLGRSRVSRMTWMAWMARMGSRRSLLGSRMARKTRVTRSS